MDGLIIGLDLRDSYTKLCVYEKEKTWTIPTVICRRRDFEQWMVGEEGFACALDGTGVVVDKLLTQVQKKGTATIGGICYQGRQLLEKFLEKVLELPAAEFGTKAVARLVITMPGIEKAMLDELKACTEHLGLDQEQVHVISHGESFIYYVLSQRKDIWNNQVALFDLSNEELYYHEIKIQRGLKRAAVQVESVNLEEGFNLNILNNQSGGKLADTILCSCGERLLQRKLFSSIFLTGKGFETQGWAQNFMKMLCSRRKVFADLDLYAAGAALFGADRGREKTAYPYVLLCPGRLGLDVTLVVEHKERPVELVIASAGSSWYDAHAAMELILDHQDYVEFQVRSVDDKKNRKIRIPLDGFPERPSRTTRIRMEAHFANERTMWVTIRDLGFGELFPAEDVKIVQEVML